MVLHKNVVTVSCVLPICHLTVKLACSFFKKTNNLYIN